MTVFTTVGLISKHSGPQIKDTVRALYAQLKKHNLKIEVSKAVSALLDVPHDPAIRTQSMGTSCDLVIVVGGDGTLLSAARVLAGTQVPLLGINHGRLGFLVDVSPEHLESRIEEALSGNFKEQKRFLLNGQLKRQGATLHESQALNDIVIHAQGVVRMIELEMAINGRFVSAQRADGLIVATPTGSTAYALSGGGPILHPTLDALAVVPICPHTLSNRPIVVGADSHIDISFRAQNNTPAQLSFDGQSTLDLAPGDVVSIRRSEREVRLLQPADHDYFDILRAKLRWSEPLR